MAAVLALSTITPVPDGNAQHGTQLWGDGGRLGGRGFA